jgi:hypothetical protein
MFMQATSAAAWSARDMFEAYAHASLLDMQQNVDARDAMEEDLSMLAVSEMAPPGLDMAIKSLEFLDHLDVATQATIIAKGIQSGEAYHGVNLSIPANPNVDMYGKPVVEAKQTVKVAGPSM